MAKKEDDRHVTDPPFKNERPRPACGRDARAGGMPRIAIKEACVTPGKGPRRHKSNRKDITPYRSTIYSHFYTTFVYALDQIVYLGQS